MRRLVAIVAVGLAAGCSKSEDQTSVQQDNVAPTPVSASSGASKVADVEAPPQAPPTLGFVKVFDKELTEPISLHRVGDTVLVAAKNRVARVADGHLEWTYETGKTWPGYGDIVIRTVSGTYPDALDITTVTTNGRAPAPTYVPLTGEGHSTTFAPGGGGAYITGIARIGSSTLVAGFSMAEGHQLAGVRGPAISRAFTTLDQAKCTEDEVARPEYGPAPPAVVPHTFGATEDGTLLSMGTLCEKRGPAAEIWDKTGAKRDVVPLGDWIESVDYSSQLLVGKGDVAWLVSGASPIVQFDAGVFTKLPPLPKPRATAFVSDEGVLYAADADAIFRYEDKQWKLEAHFDWSTTPDTLIKVGKTFWAAIDATLFRLEPTKGVAYDKGCKHPFVFLYDVSYKSEANYTFPTTRKALATFEHLDRLQLVDFREGRRRLGLIVPDRQIAELAIAHVKANMKDEEPKLLCYRPASPRKIEMKGGG